MLAGPGDLRLEAVADDLTAVVDRDGAAVRVCATEGAEVGHLPVLPQEGVRPTACGEARPDDLAALVDRDSAARSPTEGAEVGHLAVLPEEGVNLAARHEAFSDHLTSLADRAGIAAPPAERAKIDDLAVLPQDRVHTCRLGRHARPDDLAAVVHPAGTARELPEGAECGHPAAPPEKSAPIAACRAAAAGDLAELIDVGPSAARKGRSERAEVGDHPVRIHRPRRARLRPDERRRSRSDDRDDECDSGAESQHGSSHSRCSLARSSSVVPRTTPINGREIGD